jgi:hypothetical protein
MHAPSPDDARAAWLAELGQTESACWTYFHKRTAHWILFGAQIWASELLWSPAPERSLPDELLHSACREVELRAEFTTRSLGALAARARDMSSSVVLVDCTRRGTELLRDGCRDVENDIVRTARFVPGVDVVAFSETISRSIGRLADHLLEVRSGIETEPLL